MLTHLHTHMHAHNTRSHAFTHAHTFTYTLTCSRSHSHTAKCTQPSNEAKGTGEGKRHGSVSRPVPHRGEDQRLTTHAPLTRRASPAAAAQSKDWPRPGVGGKGQSQARGPQEQTFRWPAARPGPRRARAACPGARPARAPQTATCRLAPRAPKTPPAAVAAAPLRGSQETGSSCEHARPQQPPTCPAR